MVLTWAFHEGTTSMNVWRTDADGSNRMKLTDGVEDIWPVCSADEKWVYYVNWSDKKIYRVPLNGSGKAESVIGSPQGPQDLLGGLDISPDGKMLATTVHKMEAQGVADKIALFKIGIRQAAEIAGRY